MQNNNSILSIYFFFVAIIKYIVQFALFPEQIFFPRYSVFIFPLNQSSPITDMNRLYLERDELKVQILGRGFAWLDTGTMESLMDASSFIRTVQCRQGVVISSPEEIAYYEKWITKEQLLHSAEMYGKSPYGEHLRRVADGLFSY